MSFTISRPTGNIGLSLPTATIYFYKFTCILNGKSYIGRTKDIERRITQHLGQEGSQSLLLDLVEYGRQNFDISIIDICTIDDNDIHNRIEDKYIHQYDSINNGYNIRLNSPILPNNDTIDLNCIPITCKYVFDREDKLVFTCGEFTRAISYQLLTNIKQYFDESDVIPNPLIQKRMFNFNYFQILVKPYDGWDYTVGETYDLDLKYNYLENIFEIIQ